MNGSDVTGSDMPSRSGATHAIAIAGAGATSAVGRGLAAIRSALAEGRDGIAEVERFDVSPFAPVTLGACVPGSDACASWAVEAALEAWSDAGPPDVPRDRVALAVGCTEPDELAKITLAVAEALDARGPRWMVSTACTSSSNAIGLGCDLIASGDADVVIAGGAERLTPEMFAGFNRLGVLAIEKCAPFGATRGTTLGEGAGFVVLVRAGITARAPWGFVRGYGLASDAWHETSPEPRGEGIARAMRSCLAHAGLEPSDIGYVNAHATGTAVNDDAEWRGMRRVLGAQAERAPVSGTKSFFGHAQAAAGALETIATLLCMREGTIPPTLRVEGGRPGGPPDPVDAARPREHHYEHALKNNSAFGGANAALCLSRSAGAPRFVERTVRIAGVGSAQTAPDEARDEAALAATAEGLDLRGVDPSARLALAASIRALAGAGVRMRGALRDRAGIFAGGTRMPRASLAELRASIEEGGLARCSAAAFARIVLHAPAGTVSRLLALRGPTTTLADPDLAGLLALAYAARWLGSRDDADVLLACGLDERADDEEGEEGAACVVLRADEGPGPRVAGVASAGPSRVEDAIELALAHAGLSASAIDARLFRSAGGAAPSFTSARLVLDGVQAIREGARAALLAGSGSHVSCAIVLVAEP